MFLFHYPCIEAFFLLPNPPFSMAVFLLWQGPHMDWWFEGALLPSLPSTWSTWFAGLGTGEHLRHPRLRQHSHHGSLASLAARMTRHSALLVASTRRACLLASGGQCLRADGANGRCLRGALGIRADGHTGPSGSQWPAGVDPSSNDVGSPNRSRLSLTTHAVALALPFLPVGSDQAQRVRRPTPDPLRPLIRKRIRWRGRVVHVTVGGDQAISHQRRRWLDRRRHRGAASHQDDDSHQ